MSPVTKKGSMFCPKPGYMKYSLSRCAEMSQDLQLWDFQRKGWSRLHETCGAGVVCGPGLGSEGLSPHGRLFHLGQPCQGFISLYAFYGPFMVLVFLF